MGSSGKFAKRGLFIFCNSHEDSLTLMMFIYTEWSSPIWFYFLWTDWSSRQINNNSRVHSEGFDIESNWKDIIDIKFLYISHSAGYKFNCSSDIFQLYWKHFWQKDEILKLCRLNCWDISSFFFYFSLLSVCPSFLQVMSSSLQVTWLQHHFVMISDWWWFQ